MAKRKSTIDPMELIGLQQQLNQINTSTPFGQQTYGTDANGNRTFQTTLSPEMQEVATRAFSMAGQPTQQYTPPEGYNGLLQALMQKNTQRYGGGGG